MTEIEEREFHIDPEIDQLLEDEQEFRLEDHIDNYFLDKREDDKDLREDDNDR